MVIGVPKAHSIPQILKKKKHQDTVAQSIESFDIMEILQGET